MRDTLSNTLIITALALLLTACGAEISEDADDFEPSAGSADFSTFVAVGDSLTAGYKDGALYLEGQENSYPAILAQQFALVGGGAFLQPLRLPEATGSFTTIPVDSIGDRLVVVSNDVPNPPVTAEEITPSMPTALMPMPGMSFNNFGVPGAKSYNLTSDRYADALGFTAMVPFSSPFYFRFATNPVAGGPGSSVIGDAAARNPTFFVLWVGNNDVLSYATAGGYDPVNMTRATDQNTANNSDPGTYTSSNDITDDTAFETEFTTLLTDLTANPNTRGVLVNIPDVTTIPYFNTVPFNPIPMDAATAALANMAYDGYNMGLQMSGLSADKIARRTINFSAGQNAVVIVDLDLTDLTPGLPSIRQATANDYIVLPASSRIGTPSDPMNPLTTIWGVGTPLADADVLTEDEVENVEEARGAYNKTIEDFAAGNDNLVLFDAEARLTELNTTGILYGSGGISSTYIQGGGFSLDGVHPTARGYAVIANEIIKVINAGFGANIPPVDPNQYTTVFYQ